MTKRRTRKNRGGKIPAICNSKHLYGPMKKRCEEMMKKANQMKGQMQTLASKAPTKALTSRFRSAAKSLGTQGALASRLKNEAKRGAQLASGAGSELKKALAHQRAKMNMTGGRRRKSRRRRRRSRRRKSRRRSRRRKSRKKLFGLF